MRQFINDYIGQHQAALTQLSECAEVIEAAAESCVTALSRGNKLLICGNGGSAADAQHFAAELVGRFVADRPALTAIALTTDSSALTAIANDYGYDAVFSRQVEGLAREGDVLVAISTSGNSPSVLAASDAARSLGCQVIGMTGRDGGALALKSDVSVVAPAAETAHIQECHIVVVHLLCALIEKGLELA